MGRRKGDWVCKTCHRVNWFANVQCDRCKSTKPRMDDDFERIETIVKEFEDQTLRQCQFCKKGFWIYLSDNNPYKKFTCNTCSK